jgi:hypothetical protein
LRWRGAYRLRLSLANGWRFRLRPQPSPLDDTRNRHLFILSMFATLAKKGKEAEKNKSNRPSPIDKAV